MRIARIVASVLGALVSLGATAAAVGADGAPGTGTGAAALAVRAPLAVRSLLLDIAAAGARLVAVGERGHVLLSDDRGETWRQADRVPTRATLTGVAFVDAKTGFAAGHDETILATHDGGLTWALVHEDREAAQPLFDVAFTDAVHGIAIGAYGAMLVTADGGVTWARRKIEAQPLVKPAAGPATEEDEFPPDYHLNKIAASQRHLFIAAEAGQLYRSDDGGGTWLSLPSPYTGSFYGILPLEGEALLAFGLRGNLFRSDDAGVTWSRLDSHAEALLAGAERLADGTIVIVGLSGVVLVSRDGGRTFELRQQADRKGRNAVIEASPGVIATVGESGVKSLALAAAEGAASVAPPGGAR